MRTLLSLILVLSVASACDRMREASKTAATDTSAPRTDAVPAAKQDVIYMCPMDKDIRSKGPGKCPRCGMTLVADIPDPVEYHLDLTVNPEPPKPGEQAHLRFDVHDPWKENPVTKFNLVHEKLFHAFIVSRDLQFFVHDHPTWSDNSFHYDITFPKSGMYRVAGDFYPEGATPQLIAQTVFVAGADGPGPTLTRDYAPKTGQNLGVEFATIPERPVAGNPTQMRFTLRPEDGLEKYLGAWAHMLAASDDLIDMMHTHPYIADGGAKMEFRLVFPRARTYRVWVQFQRQGVVNTVHFDVPVVNLDAKSGGTN